MADGMEFTPGTGDKAAADDCGADGKVAFGKLSISANGDATPIPATAADGLSVKPTNQSVSAVTQTSVNDAASDTQLLASNASRKFLSIYNDSGSTLYVRFSGSAASATAFNVLLTAGGYYESGPVVYTGEVRGIWSADSTGAARIGEG